MSVLEQLSFDLDCDMNRIAKRFKPGVQITLIVRNPSVKDGNIVKTKDDLDEVMKVVEWAKEQDNKNAGEVIPFAKNVTKRCIHCGGEVTTDARNVHPVCIRCIESGREV